MTRFSDLPEMVQNGTMTACSGCGRIFLMAEFRLPPNPTPDDDGQNALDVDRIKCGGCGKETLAPVRDNRHKTKEGPR